MRKSLTILVPAFAAVMLAWSADYLADGPDNGRTGWVRDEKVFNTTNVKNMKLLWKIKLDSPAREMHNLFPPIILSGVATPNGRKSWRSPRESAMICSPSTQRPGNRFGTSTTTPTPAVLHTLQGAMGKSLWSSGQTIASYADASLSASQGHVYVVAHDHTFYAFGFYVPTDK